MNGRIVLMFSVALLAACSDEESGPVGLKYETGLSVVVFEDGPQTRQCEPSSITPQQSAATLTQAGIQVRRTSCGIRTGFAYPAVCGAGTGKIILHDIPAPAFGEAEVLGFLGAESLVDAQAQTGWQRVPCDGMEQFIALTNDASCAQTRNRLLTISSTAYLDTRLILLDQAGNCADAAYRQALYGESVDDLLCSNADSIAGPMKSCPNPAYSELFDTVIQNLDEPDLGLGPEYDIGVIR